MTGPENLNNIDQTLEDQKVNAQEATDLAKQINEDPDSKKLEKDISKNLTSLFSWINASVMSNGEVSSTLSSEDLWNYLTVLRYMGDMIIMDDNQQSLYKQISSLEDKLDKKRRDIDPQYKAEQEKPIELTPEQKQKNEQERQKQERQRFEANMSAIGGDFAISSSELSYLQEAIDKWFADNIKSRAWTETKEGKKIVGRDANNRPQKEIITTNYYWNSLLENGLNKTPNISEADIVAYKNVVDQLTWGKYEGNEKIYDAINKKEFDLMYANLNGNPAVANDVYKKYTSTYDAKSALELSYNDKTNFIQQEVDPALIDRLNKTPLSAYGIFAERENYLSKNTSDEARKISYNNIVNGINPDKIKSGEKLSMEDVFRLSDTQKADLARKLVAIQPLSSSEKIKKEPKLNNRTLWEISEALASGYMIVNGRNTIDKAKSTISKDLFLSYSRIIKDMRQEKMLATYDSFYRPGQMVPLMPSIDVPGTGDLTGTVWIGWGSNVGREWFNYDLEKWSVTTNSMYYGLDSEKPMSITIWAEWLDTFTWGKINISLKNANKAYIISGEYKGKQQNVAGSGKFDLGSTNTVLPADISVVDNKNGTYNIVIPPTYRDYDMVVTTESLSNWSSSHPYDELSFPITIDNGRLGNMVAPESNIYSLENEQLFQSGKYDLTAEWQKYYAGMFNEYSIYSSKTLAKNIPIVFSGGVDKNSFDNPSLFISQNQSVLNAMDFSQSPKIQAFWKEFQSQVDGDPDFALTFKDNPEQQQAQKLLLKLRTLQLLKILYDNNDMRTKVENGKFLLATWDIRTDKKFVKAGVGEFSYIKK